MVDTDWNVFCCVRSTAAKKCALSLVIGPPKLPPYWLRRYCCLSTLVIFSVSVFAFIFVSRNSSKKLPCGRFVPLLVTMFITPPLLRPYSAL